MHRNYLSPSEEKEILHLLDTWNEPPGLELDHTETASLTLLLADTVNTMAELVEMFASGDYGIVSTKPYQEIHKRCGDMLYFITERQKNAVR